METDVVSGQTLEAAPAELVCTSSPQDGLVEDAVGYSFDLPVFSGLDCAETINRFYEELLPELTLYAQETVYNTAMEQHTVASVFGSYTVDGQTEGQLVVSYQVSAQYGEEEPVISSRTDYFDLESGEHLKWSDVSRETARLSRPPGPSGGAGDHRLHQRGPGRSPGGGPGGVRGRCHPGGDRPGQD